MVGRLEEMNKPVRNDERQNKYCYFITRFLSHFGKERCVVVGSTQERLRLRFRQDEGDYDYLIISSKVIPADALEYRDDLPCFVRIYGKELLKIFPGVELIDDIFLPSTLLSMLRTEAFGHIRDFHSVLTKLSSRRGHDSLHVAIDHSIKPGKTLVSYRDIDCPELDLKQHEDNTKVLSEYVNLKKVEARDENIDIDGMEKAARVITDVWNQDKKSKVKSVFEQNYGPAIKGISNKDIGTSPLEKRSCQPGLCVIEENKAMYTEEMNKEYERIILKYRSKTSKDFIPAFPLSGKPKFLNEWKQRPRNWPQQYVVEEIFNSEFYLVAKPALTDPSIHIDFCLGFNNGEIALAKSMTSLQRKVLLVIKAVKNSFLSEFSEILTTFHWKTAIYWVSEKAEAGSLYSDTQDKLLDIFGSVLAFMTESLKQLKLMHYFIPSNLFAGLDRDVVDSIILKIEIIREDPVGALNKFFADQTRNEMKTEIIPYAKVQEFRNAYNDPREVNTIDTIFSILRSFSNEDSTIIMTALRDVLMDGGLSYLIEDMARGRDKNDISSYVQKFVMSNRISQESLIDRYVIYLTEKVDHGGHITSKEIARDLAILTAQEVLGKL